MNGESPIAAQSAVSHGLDACASHTGFCEADGLMAMQLFGELGLSTSWRTCSHIPCLSCIQSLQGSTKRPHSWHLSYRQSYLICQAQIRSTYQCRPDWRPSRNTAPKCQSPGPGMLPDPILKEASPVWLQLCRPALPNHVGSNWPVQRLQEQARL